jgi:Tol biopolymer transport system component
MLQGTNSNDRRRQKALVILSGVSVAIFLGVASNAGFTTKKGSPVPELVEAPAALETAALETAAAETVALETAAIETITETSPTLSNARRIESAHNTTIRTVQWSPDGSRFASGGVEPDKNIYVWDAASLKKLATLEYTGTGDAIYLLAWSPDSSRIASTHFDRTVRIYDTNTGALTKEFSGHTDIVEGVAW